MFQAEIEARRNQLMRDMAQLRLRAEVSQLERYSGGTDRAQQSSAAATATAATGGATGATMFPPYLVPDASALAQTLHLMKYMAHSARFIIIVPLAGNDGEHCNIDVVS